MKKILTLVFLILMTGCSTTLKQNTGFDPSKPFTTEKEHEISFFIVYNSTLKRVSCQSSNLIYNHHKKLSSKDYTSFSDCFNSKSYKELKKVWEKPNKPKLPTKLEKYVKEFERRTKIKVDRSKVKLGRLTNNKIGICHSKTQEVVIDREYWNRGSDSRDILGIDRELTVYHELAHCYIARGHNDRRLLFNINNVKYNCPISIMNPTSWKGKDLTTCWTAFKEYYWKELMYGGVNVKAYYLSKGKYRLKKDVFIVGDESSIRFNGITCVVLRTLYKSKKKDGYYETGIDVSCTAGKSKLWTTVKKSCATFKGTKFINDFRYGVSLGLNTHDGELIIYSPKIKEGFKVKILCEEFHDSKK